MATATECANMGAKLSEIEANGTRNDQPLNASNPLKLLASKAGDFLHYSPASENIGHSESDFGRMGLPALPSFHRNTPQMLGFSEGRIASENCCYFEDGRGKGAGN